MIQAVTYEGNTLSPRLVILPSHFTAREHLHFSIFAIITLIIFVVLLLVHGGIQSHKSH